MRHQAKMAVPSKNRAGAARLAPTSLWEGSRELRESRHLPIDFMKSGESASALARNHHLSKGNCPTKAKPRIWTLEFSFLIPLTTNKQQTMRDRVRLE
jgi:hypothetical protein